MHSLGTSHNDIEYLKTETQQSHLSCAVHGALAAGVWAWGRGGTGLGGQPRRRTVAQQTLLAGSCWARAWRASPKRTV